MKAYILILMFLITSIALPQNRHRGPGGDPMKKINQLEKVKLMEILDMDDATAVKFFNLKNQHQKTMMDLRDKSDGILDLIEETLDNRDSKNLSSLNKMIDEFKANEDEMSKQRLIYLNEAEKLLSPENFAKLIIFERNFRAEVRDVLMGDRKRRERP